MFLSLILLLLQTPNPAFENEYVLVTRDAAPCASAKLPVCGHRVIVALGAIEITKNKSVQRLTRGDIVVFKTGETYTAPTGGPFFEVNIKLNHPAVKSPAEIIPPEKNAIRFDGPEFYVFEERLGVGDTRPRHSHSQRVVMQLNKTRLQQWPDGEPEIFVDIVPDRVTFNAPVIHTAKNVGDAPLRGIVVEFKPERPKSQSK